jgi:hypothetical protein
MHAPLAGATTTAIPRSGARGCGGAKVDFCLNARQAGGQIGKVSRRMIVIFARGMGRRRASLTIAGVKIGGHRTISIRTAKHRRTIKGIAKLCADRLV